MPTIDATAWANLLAYAAAGTRIQVCEYLKVTWATGVISYYGAAAWNDAAPYTGIGHTIEARLIPSNPKDPFHELDLNPDLKTDSINIVFDDIDKAITTKFQTYSSGVACEFFYYYPQISTTVSIWSGQLQAPDVYGWKTIKAVATNGYKSRELKIPGRNRPKECTANVFSGLLPDLDSIRSSLCPYDKHLGGSVGTYKTGTTPWTDCPKDTASCNARLGTTDARYHGGFDTSRDTATVLGDQGHAFLAVSRGNSSFLTDPVRLIFGDKVIKSLPLLHWRPNGDAGNPYGSVSTIFEIGEGPFQQIDSPTMNGAPFGTGFGVVQAWYAEPGTRGQPDLSVGFRAHIDNFSSTGILFIVYAQVDPGKYNPTNLNATIHVLGFAEVCVYTDATTKTRIYSNNRAWCLLELLKNQKFGLGYSESLFEIADWITLATYLDQIVQITVNYPDGEAVVSTPARRSTMNAILEGRPVGEQIEDIASSGGFSIPFQHNGKFTVTPFRVATSGELSAAKTFYDTGSNVNIIWDSGQPAIELSETPADKVLNEIEIRFEEASNSGTERPITVDDRNQKLKAGRQMGPGYFLSVPKKFSGVGIDNMFEAVRLGYRFLRFGQHDQGGTQNNLKAVFTTPFEHVLGLKRYQIIKLSSALLSGHSIGTNDGVNNWIETPQYFRILRMQRTSNGRCKVTTQAYNHTAYTAFEVDAAVGVTVYEGYINVSGAGHLDANDDYENVGMLNGKPSYEVGSKQIYWNGTSRWHIDVDGTTIYRALAAVAAPHLTGAWLPTISDYAPAPIVSLRTPPDVGSTELTLGTPTYSTTTGILTVPIN